MKAWKCTIAGLSALVLAGCASGPDPAEEDRRTAEQIRERLDAPEPEEGPEERRIEALQPPEALTEELTPDLLPSPLTLRTDEPRFDLTVDDVPARHFYQGVVEDTPYNVVVHPAVEGRVSMSLRDVSVPEIMQAAQEVFGYEYRRTDTAYFIKPAEPETRIFRLDYINVDRSGSSGLRVSGGELAGDEDNGDIDRVLGTRVDTSSSSNVWEEVQEAIERMLDGQEDASVVVSPDAGRVIVRGMPGTMRDVEEFLSGLQGSLNRQVILEARILEIELEDGRRTGIDWSILGAQGTERMTGQFGSTTGRVLRARGDGDGFERVITALEEQGELHVLSSPEVSTLNNRKAVIKAGTDEFFQTNVDINRQQFEGQRFTEINPEFEPFFSGVALDVTPYIDEDDWITLHIQPSVTEVRDQERIVNVGRGSGNEDEDGGEQTVTFSLAQSDVRQSDSIVRARNNELIAIGGLIEERDEERVTQVPVLGSIPWIGAAFRDTEVETRKYELVILLRPRIVGEGRWSPEVERRIRSAQEPFLQEGP